MNFDYQLHQAVSDYHFLAPFALSGSRGQTPKTLRYQAVLTTILETLVAMHRNGHIHRDIKPDNLLVTESGVRLADFGHAHGIQKSVGTLNGAGTPGYMAPEIVSGRPATSASDIFSLSVVGREMLLGRHPQEVRNLCTLAGVPTYLVQLLYRMSSPAPAERPTAEAALRVLREKMSGSLIQATPQPDPGLAFAVTVGLGLLFFAFAKR